jgi:hypothetical protein
MLSVDKVYRQVSNLANKDQNSGNFSPMVFNEQAEFAQLEVIRKKHSPAGRQAYEDTSQSTDSMSSLKVRKYITFINGVADKPNDWLYWSSAYNVYYGTGQAGTYPVELLRDNEIAPRLVSEVDKPSKYFPAMEELGETLKVYPADINQLLITYLKTPDSPEWAYTLTNGRPVFNAGASVNFTLSEDDFGDLVYEICMLMGIEFREPFLFQSPTIIQNNND